MSPGEAEVAFLVEDQHQGRGIAQLLLEHLAQAGRENGVDRFVADVLPENVKMIQVFRDAGYRIEGGYDEGVLRLVFPIDPTDTAIGVMQDREHRAEAASIAAFFDARSVAVIGASRRQDTIGQALVRHLVLGDYAGRIYVVNPTADSVAGMPAYPTVAAIPDQVDVAIVAVPADVGDRRGPRLRGQGRPRPDRDLVRLRRGRGGGLAAPAQSCSDWPAATGCA